MKIEHYAHKLAQVLLVDPQPGNYYVSVKDGQRVGLLAGPFKTHAEALAMADRAKAKANEVNPWSAFMAFGTLRMKDDYDKPGVLNALLGL